MKKIGLILLILFTGCLFNACSDDDNNKQNNEIPVIGCVLPSYMKLGTQIVLPGKGFSGQAELYLKNEAEDLIKIPAEKIVNTGFHFTVPENLEKGYYTVILKQGGEWELGKVRIVKDFIKIKRLKSLGMDFDGDVIAMTLEYDDENRIVSFESLNGKLMLSYDSDRIEVTGENVSFSYTLQNGKIINSTNNGQTGEWNYSTAGNLENAAGNNYTYTNGNLITTDYSDMMLGLPFEYADGSPARVGAPDIAACCMYLNYAMEDIEFLAYLSGFNGKQSVNLPTALNGMGDFTYQYENNNPNGNVTRAILASPLFELINMVFEYEMADVFQ